MPITKRQVLAIVSVGMLSIVGVIAGTDALGKPPLAIRRAPSSATISAAHSTTADARLSSRYGKLPLSFEANRGQTDPLVDFIAHGHGQELFLKSGEADLVLEKGVSAYPDTTEAVIHDITPLTLLFGDGFGGGAPGATAHSVPAGDSKVLAMTLVDARKNLRGIGLDELPGKANYLIGNDPAKWKTNIETYAKVKYEAVYPGIDLIYYGNQQQLEYDFVVGHGSDPGQIKMRFRGADRISIDKSTGDLLLTSDGQSIRFLKPVVYQQKRGPLGTISKQGRHLVDGQYVLQGERQVSFQVAAYDRSQPLVIDPVLSYSTYLGGLLTDFATRIAVDSNGDAYVTGATISTDFPVTSGANASTLHVGAKLCGRSHPFPCPDAFVTKLNPAGTAAVYSTYLGGTRSDLGIGIAVDSNGDAYVAGESESLDFPTTASGYQHGPLSQPQFARAFLAKLDPTGANILYATYLGGTAGSWGAGQDKFNDSTATAVAVDNSGNAYVSGYTRSNSFPTTTGVIQPNLSDSTVYTGTFPFPKNGCSIVNFTYAAPNYTVTYRCSDGFVAKLNTTASGPASLAYSTYLGGNNYDFVTDIAIDGNGNAYLSGTTLSTDFPTVSASQSAFSGGQCLGPGRHPCAAAFVTKLNATATGIDFSTYLYGNNDSAATGIAVDSTGNAYVTGFTDSTTFPTTTGVKQPAIADAQCALGTYFLECPDAFVAKFSSTGSRTYSTYLGGTGVDAGLAIATDTAGNAYVTGLTNSTDFPTTIPTQSILGGGTCSLRVLRTIYSLACPDAFISKLDPTGATLFYSSYFGGNNADIGTGIAINTNNNLNDIFLAGGAMSTGLATSGTLQTSPSGLGDAFVAKIASVAGFSFTAVTGGSTSATVSAGQSATYSLQLSPSGGYSGTVTLTCTGAPAGATCTPSTNSLNVSATASVPFTVTVATTARSAIPAIWIDRLWAHGPLQPIPFVGMALLLLLGALGIVFARTPKRASTYVCAILLVAGLATFMTACGSSAATNSGTTTGSTGGSNGTPAGSSTLKVTGTSQQGSSQSIDLNLTVN